MDTKTCVRRGNIINHEYPSDHAGRYIGNGRFGTVLGPLGLNLSPRRQMEHPEEGRSQFMHMGHWGRFRFVSDAMQQETAADYLLPLLRLHWEKEAEQVDKYHQCQDFYDGNVHTAFSCPSGEAIGVTSWFDWEKKDLAGLQIEVKSGTVFVCLSVVDEFVPYPFLYQKQTRQQFSVLRENDQWKIVIACGDTVNQIRSALYLRTDAPVEKTDKGLRICLAPGLHHVFLSYGSPCADCEHSLERTATAWHDLWERSGLVSFPDEHAQQVYIRSLACLLSSYGDDYDVIQPTNGLTGNIFPFHFVQDLGYIAPALMMTGHGHIVRRWVEYFADRVDGLRQYVHRLWPDSQGIYPPWELPLGDIEGYHAPSVPIIFCYEPHNVGYLCRIACEAAEELGDAAWTEKYALPLIAECAAFYRSAARRGDDGRWHLKWFPSIGQDEAGGRNQTDYLCSLYSAKYCFQSAVRYGLDQDGSYAVLLAEGLAFDALIGEDGVSHTALGADDRGKQKHPVQLDGLSYMPVESAPLPEEKAAYDIRYDLTYRAKEPYFFGWTLGQFLLAGANLAHGEGWRHDWAQLRASRYTDSEWVQFYETSDSPEKSYYATTHGMILQSLIRLCVNDYWGRLDVAPCAVWDGVIFERICTKDGVSVSGEISHGQCAYTLTACRDCTLMVDGKPTILAKGEQHTGFRLIAAGK